MADSGIILRRKLKAELELDPPIEGELAYTTDTEEICYLSKGILTFMKLKEAPTSFVTIDSDITDMVRYSSFRYNVYPKFGITDAIPMDLIDTVLNEGVISLPFKVYVDFTIVYNGVVDPMSDPQPTQTSVKKDVWAGNFELELFYYYNPSNGELEVYRDIVVIDTPVSFGIDGELVMSQSVIGDKGPSYAFLEFPATMLGGIRPFADTISAKIKIVHDWSGDFIADHFDSIEYNLKEYIVQNGEK